MSTERLLLGSILLAASCQVPAPPDGSVPAEHERLAQGDMLFQMYCAVCHGSSGRADGHAAPFLFPQARDLGEGRFRLVSTQNGAPSERDLLATLRRGIPGSAMPAWSWVGEEDLTALARYVRFLAENGLAQDLEAAARAEGTELAAEAVERLAAQRLAPEGEQEAPLAASADAARREHGRALYRQHCADCHGPDGRGQREPRRDEDGRLNWARDLSLGFLKGEAGRYDLACRIRNGMPGSAMLPTHLAPEDEAALLDFLAELIPPGSSERLVQRRASLDALRVPRLPTEPWDEAWREARSIDVVLAPLWWHDDAALAARLSALHDGESLAVRLTWADATGVLRLFTESSPTDGAALQLSAARRPVLFGMGAEGKPTDLWHWQALRLEDVSGALDLVFPVPHLATPQKPSDVRVDVPIYQRLLGQLQPSERADRITVEGVPTLHAASRNAGEVHVSARWEDDAWSVVFVRRLRCDDPGQVSLAPGARAQLACAIWNGAAGDEGARKSISIWQELVLAP
jgi:DMSO reductase family type II enzyme heme b subunit